MTADVLFIRKIHPFSPFHSLFSLYFFCCYKENTNGIMCANGRLKLPHTQTHTHTNKIAHDTKERGILLFGCLPSLDCTLLYSYTKLGHNLNLAQTGRKNRRQYFFPFSKPGSHSFAIIVVVGGVFGFGFLDREIRIREQQRWKVWK